MISRVKALLRRTQAATHVEAQLSHGDILLDNDRHAVFLGETPCELTYKEFELLKYLMLNKGIVLSRDKNMEQLWGFEYVVVRRTVDMHIKTKRQSHGPTSS